MFGKNDLLAGLDLECKILIHLYEQLPRERWQETLDYRPSPDQRSTLELLTYLSYCGIGGCLAALEVGFDGYRAKVERSVGMAAEDFPAAMERQRAEMAEVLAGISEEELSTRMTKNPIGQEISLGRALMELPLRWLVAYRMQLFLYARALGADIWTPDCWYGMHRDRPAPKS
jgi:hypothetical protein